MVFSSLSRVRRHVVIGRPLFLFPWGFHSSDCLVMLFGSFRSVCPIHFHFRVLMVDPTGFWFVLHHRSSLVILSGHLMRRICRRHELTKTCSLCSSPLVSRQVSEPYSSTDLTDLREPPGGEPMKPGSQTREGADLLRNLLSSKTASRIGAWNVRTLYETGKGAQVAREMDEYRSGF